MIPLGQWWCEPRMHALATTLELDSSTRDGENITASPAGSSRMEVIFRQYAFAHPNMGNKLIF